MPTAITAPEGAPFRVKGVHAVNFKPHPYTIGARHVAYASQNCGGILGDTAITEAEKEGARCQHGQGRDVCNLPFTAHTCDRALFVEVTENYPDLKDVPGLEEWLLSIKDTLIAEKLEGVEFVRGGSNDGSET